MRFSDRFGITRPREALQQNSIDQRLRNRLWNDVSRLFVRLNNGEGFLRKNTSLSFLFHRLQDDFFGRDFDELDDVVVQVIADIKREYIGFRWHDVYNFIEYLGALVTGSRPFDEAVAQFRNNCNVTLTAEMSAYRFVGTTIAPITSDREIIEIEAAIQHKGLNQSISQHISTAVTLLSRRDNPDWRNSIKESISAVEAAARLLTGDEKATLGDALKVLDRDKKLHGALHKAFSALYGYTSNADGIRHALLDAPDLDFDDAKFFLVACSAFANYLIGKKGAA